MPAKKDTYYHNLSSSTPILAKFWLCEFFFGAKFKLKFCQSISIFQNAPHGGVNHSKCRLEGFRASYLEVINQE